ncbi:MAG: exodeoxyribonuclease VII large subunit, partial [Clostridiales bacterium]|nr:exodeoxyribonuclease VII large subunit [Clostridiales bacterium]
MAKFYTVTQVNSYIKSLLSSDFLLSNLWVQGEISNYKKHYSGHIYFTLKDPGGLIKCIMFSTKAEKLAFDLKDGMKVFVKGSISVYEKDGQYQLYVETMQPDGEGALYLAYEKLKRKLETEGLFDRAHKKKIPVLPKVIGVVTSRTGSVIKDILNVAYRRFP